MTRTATNRETQRITAERPGHMIHIDVKKVGRIPDGGGWRVHGKGSEQAKVVDRTKRRGTRTGYAFLHSAIDGYSRLAYTEALPDEKAVTAVAFLDRARAWFATHGIAAIERIVTDNGACYRANAFREAMAGSRHQRITPYTPRHNGKVERYNRILAEEFLYARIWHSEQQRADALVIWNRHYNYHRPHSAHDGQPPASQTPLHVNNVLASYTPRRPEPSSRATPKTSSNNTATPPPRRTKRRGRTSRTPSCSCSRGRGTSTRPSSGTASCVERPLRSLEAVTDSSRAQRPLG